jgi:hypothetical protein
MSWWNSIVQLIIAKEGGSYRRPAKWEFLSTGPRNPLFNMLSVTLKCTKAWEPKGREGLPPLVMDPNHRAHRASLSPMGLGVLTRACRSQTLRPKSVTMQVGSHSPLLEGPSIWLPSDALADTWRGSQNAPQEGSGEATWTLKASPGLVYSPYFNPTTIRYPLPVPNSDPFLAHPRTKPSWGPSATTSLFPQLLLSACLGNCIPKQVSWPCILGQSQEQEGRKFSAFFHDRGIQQTLSSSPTFCIIPSLPLPWHPGP